MLRVPVCRNRAYSHLASLSLLALIFGCGGGDGPTDLPVQRATKLALITPPPSQAQSGVAFTAQPAVQLQDDQGGSVSQAGVPIGVSIATGGGSLIGTISVNTSSSGRADFTGLGVRGTIGPRTLTFTSTDIAPITSATIDLTSGVAAVIAAQDASPQTAVAGGAVAVPPSVIVTDGDNNRVAGVPVTFQVSTGGGAVVPETPVNTDDNGIASVTSWTLGSTPGANTLTATAAPLPGSSVVFTATGSPPLSTITGTITISNSLLAQTGDATRIGAFRTAARIKSNRLQMDDRLRSSGIRSLPSRGRPHLPEYTPDELIVTFRPRAVGAPPAGSSALSSRSAGAAIAGEIRSRLAPHLSASVSALTGVSPAIMAARIRVRDPANIANVAAALRTDPAVATVERNGLMSLEDGGKAPAGRRYASIPTRSSNDPFSAYQAWNYGMIDLPEAWTISTGSASVLVAVLDDGIRFDHPDIAANLTSDGYDFVSNSFLTCSGDNIGRAGDGDDYDPDPTIPAVCSGGPDSVGGHGLHVAGTIGAVGNDGLGVSGINWTVRIRPVRVMAIDGFGTFYDIAQGILYAAGLPADDGTGGTVQAATGAKIINMSLGGPTTSAVLEDAVSAATTAGALIVAGAGNDATSDPIYPAAYPEVLAVSAVGPDRELASYSSFGSAIDIAAPGGDFVDGDESFGILSLFWSFRTQAPVYVFAAGTSMAAPHVTGVAALLLAQNPGLTRSELRSRLLDYAVDAGSTGRDSRYGAGIVNARNSLARNFGPSHQLRARLYDALNGGVVQTVAVAGDGSYSFPVANGSYQVFAGEDEEGDQLIGQPGRRWGAYGGAATPSRVRVDGPGTHQASFRLGFPSEDEPNGTFDDNANTLPVDGYLIAEIPLGDDDVFRVLIPRAGQYTFETSAVDGACGFALEEDTSEGLYRPDQTAIGSSDDIDAANNNFCSKITTTLQPGTYFLRVEGKYGGRYRVQARSGP